MVEKGLIPPNALFEKLNPAIDEDFLRVKVGYDLTSKHISFQEVSHCTRFPQSVPLGHAMACDALLSMASGLEAPTHTSSSMMPGIIWRSED